MGFLDSCQREIDRLDRIDGMEAKIYVLGDEWFIPPKDEIILFRIIQESSQREGIRVRSKYNY